MRTPVGPIAFLFASVILGVFAAGFSNQLHRRSERQWRTVAEVGTLSRNLETLEGLNGRSMLVDDGARAAIEYVTDLTKAEVDANLAGLDNSQVLPSGVAETTAIVRSYLAIEMSASGTQQSSVFTEDYAPVRESVAALSAAMKAEAISTGKRSVIVSWTVYPLLLTLSGLMVVRNARARKRFVERETQARESAKFEAMVATGHDVITIVDPVGNLSYVSPAASRILGMSADDLVNANTTTLLSKGDASQLDRASRQLDGTTHRTSLELVVQHPTAGPRYFELTGSDAAGIGSAGTMWTWYDIHDRKVLEEELKHQAFHDPLTSLANRALFQSRLEHALTRAQRTGAVNNVLFVDLDGFKAINDSLGHAAGDQALCLLADAIGSITRPGDTLARLGGDEFALLLEATSEDDAADIADRLLLAVRQQIVLSAEGEATVEVALSASIGMASSSSASSGSELLRNADMAMYAAKRGGKNCVRVYSADMHTAAEDRLRLQSELRGALDRDELRLFYQPLVDLSTQRVAGFEALLRWQHPERGLLAPGAFIALAEESGLIIEIGRWVMKTAVTDGAALNRDSDVPLKMNLNLSPRQFQDSAIVDVLRDALASTGIDPYLVVLEITETALIDEVGGAIELLERLKAFGVRLALDDFGTGFSTLSSLRSLPIDIVKIDRSFVANDSASDERTRLLTESIVTMGHQLGLETVAEGIETDSQMDRMRALGCGTGQGYLFSKPVPLANMASVVADIEAQLRASSEVASAGVA
jgi:diguanylate cyclase (GGDEF)-like protein/PAS domain S-box-containing protein